MEASSLNPVDIAVIIILLISALMAFARGFVREVLSVAAWIGAALATLWLFPVAAPFTRAHIDTQYVADGVTILGLFTGSLIALSLLTGAISGRVQESSLSAIDRSLGFAFGIVRGAVLVSLAYLFAAWLWPEQPVWLREAKSRPYLETGADMLRGFLPNADLTPAQREAERARHRLEEAENARRTLERLANPRPTSAGNAAVPETDRGYNADDLGRLDQVIKSTDQPFLEPDRRPDGDQR
ncbi:CvpA family protein [Niveispirillum fermenti]|uniref:CvpA family protein n=1 Tax=Niveispirillum fermenti TaxID=1233113 RepID=UPI003A889F79